MARTATILLAGLMTCTAGRSVAGAPAQAVAETPLETARRLAASDKREDRVKAFQILAALKKPGTALGDEYTYRYAELCLRFHGEGEPRMLEEARKDKAYTGPAETVVDAAMAYRSQISDSIGEVPNGWRALGGRRSASQESGLE